ncbi:P-type DNA transfer protein VirB5 [Burkholderia sp. Ac-20345]|uniref:P-type DNA transfer protein VirB5 n=1 Tax=Burkholderia sp. Ac-20345 TaxID=2703891 RepID=UPI00197C6802|nr:P-type DNA transfer protein VirB5 [Burkholderia sp. Ac-20345]MBN3780518.1 P-type DNA transfer protein VirB5 [Burkholderia sp. Ac-20345]
MKMKLKRIAICAALCIGTAAPIAASASPGIPTYDVTAVLNAVQQLQQLKQQYDVLMQGFQQAQQQYKSLTGIRGFGDFMNNPLVRSYLPSDWQQVYDQLRNTGWSNLSGSAQAIRNAMAIYNCSGQTGAALNVCQGLANKPAQDQAFTQQAYQSAMSRVDGIQSLINQISSTQDPKGIAELQARIAGEQVAVENERVKLELFNIAGAQGDKMLQQQQRELSLQQTAKRDRLASNLSAISY